MRICDLLDRRSVCLKANPVSKEDAISILVEYMEHSGCLSDVNRFREAVLDRERKSSTGLGEGIAIPHAKSQGVLRPGLATMVVPNGVDFDSIDGEPVHLLFLIASPHQASEAHLDVLARLSTLLMDENFRKDLLNAKTVDEYLAVIDRAEGGKEQEEQESQKTETSGEQESSEENKPKKKSYDLVAVTACPAGLSHTYMAAEALEQKARELGVTIKVEADGAAGNRNSLLPEDIASAKAVIVAADRAVDIDRFLGKRMVRTGVVSGVHHPEKLIKQALDPNCPVFKGGTISESSNLPMKMYRHLMSGLTYILPLVATAGILAAIARLEVFRGSSLGLFLDSISYSIGTLLFPVLSAFIAFSVAGRMALVAGFTGGVMADLSSAGVVGALLNGFVGGAVAFVIARIAQRFLKGHDAMFALLVYPLAGAVFTTLIAQFITGIPASLIDNSIENFLIGTDRLTLALIGAVLAGMMSADMGGPFNKIAYAIGVLSLADCLPENGPGLFLMGCVMLGGMVPPLSAGVATFLASKKFTPEERALGLSAIIKGFLFITEGVLPFLKIARRLRIACVLGSATAGFFSMFFRCGVVAPHGGIFIMPIAVNPLQYALSLLIGVVVGSICFMVLVPKRNINTQEQKVAVVANGDTTSVTSSQEPTQLTPASIVEGQEKVALEQGDSKGENPEFPLQNKVSI